MNLSRIQKPLLTGAMMCAAVSFFYAQTDDTIQTTEREIEEVVIVGKGVIDLAADRKTPIAVTTIRAEQIREKSGNFDLPEILKSTPSVQNNRGGGFGDGEMYLRGFDQSNTAFLLNGQPINGMEDGLMYWSNWSGVMDIANGVQVQRGLGSSKLAISSVGGTVNIVTKTLDTKEGGFIQQMVANDDYYKTSAYYSTGLMREKWAVSAMFSHWEGTGYVDGTRGQGQTYFLSVGYKPAENHTLNLLITGAPQWHGTSGLYKLSTLLDKGRKYNNNYGFLNGEYYAGGRNYYHKPVINLNWDYDINDKAELSTVVYSSFGRGGFAGTSGVSVDADTDLLNFDQAMANGTGFSRSSVNSHNWYGLVSNLNYKINSNLNFNVGFDGRMYNGIHFRQIADFFGQTSINVTNNDQLGNYTVDQSFGYNPWTSLFDSTPRNQRVDRDYEEQINYIGGFGQLEYAKNNFSAYVQGAISTQSHQREGYFTEFEVGKSKKVNNEGYNVKGGLSYTVANNHRFFGNAGYYSRQPYHDNMFTNYRSSNELNPFYDTNQKITGLEAGYQFKSNPVKVNLNAYHTTWDDRILFAAVDADQDGVSEIVTQTTPSKQIHKGIELEVFTYPFKKLYLNGFVSLGDWEYDRDVTSSDYDDNGNLISEGETKYLKGVKIGNVAQFTAGVSAAYQILENLKVDANLNYYDNIYGNTDITSNSFNDPNHLGAIKLPAYETVDAGITFKLPINFTSKSDLTFRVNVNNIFDEKYIERTQDNIHEDPNVESWKGVNVDNRVRFGYGRTWNAAIRLNF